MKSWRLATDEVQLERVAFPAPGEISSSRKVLHLFDGRERNAINAALAAGRPLLVRGEPGVGKSQLAAAAAVGLGRRFVSRVIDARTESQDLHFSLDAVRRLADAQLIAHSGLGAEETLEQRLDELRYTKPGPLWWAFDWSSAHAQASRARVLAEGTKETAPNGVVVLLDEIDKADSSVPNGLLECLGQRQFPAPGGLTIRCGAMAPLVVVTTNEERSLPDPFLRRCLVLEMLVPTDEKELLAWLLRRGRAHFSPEEISQPVLEEAAAMLIEDRLAAKRRRLPPPGGAELLDLLRALFHLEKEPAKQLDLLEDLRDFTLRKHPEDAR